MSIVGSNALAGASGQSAGGGPAPSGFQIDRSVRLNSADSAYFSRTPSSAGNRKTWTWSGWIKKVNNTTSRQFIFNADIANQNSTIEFLDNAIRVFDFASSAFQWQVVTSAVYRDNSAWMHVVVSFDTTQATSSDRVKIYVNGSLQALSTASYPSQNYDAKFNAAVDHRIGSVSGAPSLDLDAYLTEIHFVDGTALAASDFGEYDSNNVWQPKEFTGNYKSFDNSQTWSSNITTTGNSGSWWPTFPATNAFNNNDANYAHANGDGSQTAVVTLTLSPGVSCSNTVTLLGGMTGSGTATISVNGGTAVSLTSGSSATTKTNVSFSGTVTSIVITKTSSDASGMLIYGFEIDGKRLVDNSVSISSNSFHLDFSDNSSSSALGLDQRPGATQDPTGTTYGTVTGGTVANVFDGVLGSSSELSIRPIGSGVTLDTAVTATSSVRIYGSSENTANTRYEINGTDTSAVPETYPTRGWTTISGLTFPITINSFGIDGGNSGNGARLSAIEIDGTILTGTANDWSVNNISVAAGAGNDSLIDTPTDYEAASGENGGNYCTWNPLDMETGVITLSEGNLKTVTTSSTGDNVRGTFGFSSGKWYWECTVTDFSGGFDIGFATPEWNLTAGDVGSVANSWSVSDSGTSKNQGSNTGSATSAFNSTGKVIGIAFDADAGSVKYFIDGTDQGVIFSGLDTSKTYMPAIYLRVATTGGIWNFGQRGSYTYAPPSGYKGLCTTNLPDPTIADGSTAFDVNVWDGDGTTSRLISTNFSPDFTWMKIISQSGQWHLLADSVRGGDKTLSTNNTNAEVTRSGFVSFDSTGFTIGDGNSNPSGGQTLVGFAWDGGSSTVSNTDGSITSSVRANASAGFSICTYTGSTGNQSFGHGLNAAPKLIAIKNRSSTADWFVMVDIGTTYYKYGHFNSTAALADATSQPVSSTTVTLGNNNAWFGANGDNYLALCWAAVEGYSAFGSYTGNGSTDGPFVFTGFRPRWVMVKRSDSDVGSHWWIWDTARLTYNSINNPLLANLTNAEITSYPFDALSNGFKIRDTNPANNGSGGTFFYAAFAEHPFKTARAR